MTTYSLYKVIHLTGIILIFFSFGAAVFQMINSDNKNFANKKLIAIFHGLGLFIALVGGFGLLAKMGIIKGWPMWVWIKLAIWVILGGAIALVYRAPKMNKLLWFTLPLVGVIAAYLAQYKPF